MALDRIWGDAIRQTLKERDIGAARYPLALTLYKAILNSREVLDLREGAHAVDKAVIVQSIRWPSKVCGNHRSNRRRGRKVDLVAVDGVIRDSACKSLVDARDGCTPDVDHRPIRLSGDMGSDDDPGKAQVDSGVG